MLSKQLSAGQAATAPRPQSHYVVTNKFLENWVLPTWMPVRLVDREMCNRFGIRSAAYPFSERTSGDWIIKGCTASKFV